MTPLHRFSSLSWLIPSSLLFFLACSDGEAGLSPLDPPPTSEGGANNGPGAGGSNSGSGGSDNGSGGSNDGSGGSNSGSGGSENGSGGSENGSGGSDNGSGGSGNGDTGPLSCSGGENFLPFNTTGTALYGLPPGLFSFTGQSNSSKLLSFRTPPPSDNWTVRLFCADQRYLIAQKFITQTEQGAVQIVHVDEFVRVEWLPFANEQVSTLGLCISSTVVSSVEEAQGSTVPLSDHKELTQGCHGQSWLSLPRFEIPAPPARP